MIDLHTHTLLSDGCLLPSELARRATVAGYSAIAMTDHADESNIEAVISQLKKASNRLNKDLSIRVVPGVELTHIPPRDIPRMVKKARKLGAAIIVGHGETIAEPVARGTNAAFISASVDILAHPGLVSEKDSICAAKKSVRFEITARAGHSLANGHVAAMARAASVKMVINTDAHGPSDLISDETALKIALGAGLNEAEFKEIRKNALELLKKTAR